MSFKIVTLNYKISHSHSPPQAVTPTLDPNIAHDGVSLSLSWLFERLARLDGLGLTLKVV